jgi:hypothetical protein
MNKEIKAKWVAALRSGEYKQASGVLRDSSNRFCCLGVLCNLHAQSHPKVAAGQIDPQWYLDQSKCLPPVVERWANISEAAQTELAKRNDGAAGRKRHTFAEIADYIEEKL